MPIFSKRRLSYMLDELSTHLEDTKLNGIYKSLNHVNTNAALAAEAELSVMWAISQVADFTPEPELPNSSRRPDIYSPNLFGSKPAVIEVRAISDDSFSGKKAMERTANIICGFANKIRKGAGKHLHFTFSERSFYKAAPLKMGSITLARQKFCRERCVEIDFNLSEEVKLTLQNWICDTNWPSPKKIQIISGKTDVTIEWRKIAVPGFRTFCSMPAVAYDLEDNPIYKALKKKSSQIKGAETGVLRCIFLVDVGSKMLRELHVGNTTRETSGEEVIRHAIKKLKIDHVIVLSPYNKRQYIFGYKSEMVWNVTCFDRQNGLHTNELLNIHKMVSKLPKPNLEGYQARDIHRQGGFNGSWNTSFLPTIIESMGTVMTIKISAQLLHEYLAGKSSIEEFQQKLFHQDSNYFLSELTKGKSLDGVEFEPGGLDRDDDYIVFKFDYIPTKTVKIK